VPVSKPKEFFSKSLTCNDFRGIAISQILSKAFEYCGLDRFKDTENDNDSQFGFKKSVGCSFAIRTLRNIVNSYMAVLLTFVPLIYQKRLIKLITMLFS